MTDPVLILCMKWGTLYGARDVNNLARGVRRHLARPHRFICFTDDPSGLHPGIEALPLPDLGPATAYDQLVVTSYDACAAEVAPDLPVRLRQLRATLARPPG